MTVYVPSPVWGRVGGLILFLTMSNRFSRMMWVLERVQRTGSADVRQLAGELGMTPGTVRRYLRELRAVNVLPPDQARLSTHPQFSTDPQLSTDPASTTEPRAVVLSGDEIAALHVGARFLAAEGDPAMATAAQKILTKLDHVSSTAMSSRLADIDALYSFSANQSEAQIRQVINQAITERRVISMRYRREHDARYMLREVEPLAQFFTDNHWSFLAYCRLRQDLRTFRHDRARGVKLTEQHFEPRQGLSLERFIQRRKAALRTEPRAVGGT